MDRTERFFDKMYRATEGRRFSAEPRPHIKEIPRLQGYRKGSTELEIGGGEGQNSIFLAKEGYECTISDISVEALKRASRYAADAGISVMTRKLDIRTGKISGNYDCIVATLVFHNMKDGERYSAVGKMMAATSTGGINFLSFYTEREGKKEFSGLEEGVVSMYKEKGWKITRCYHNTTKLQNGKAAKVTTLIVQKPRRS